MHFILDHLSIGNFEDAQNLANCGHWIAFRKLGVKADVVVMTEGSSFGCVMASSQDSTGV